MSEFDLTYWKVKIIYDLAGYITAFFVTWFFYKKVLTKSELPNPFKTAGERSEYYLFVIA